MPTGSVYKIHCKVCRSVKFVPVIRFPPPARWSEPSMAVFSPRDSTLSLNTSQGHARGNFTVLHFFRNEGKEDIGKKPSPEVSAAKLTGALSSERSLTLTKTQLCQAGFVAELTLFPPTPEVILSKGCKITPWSSSGKMALLTEDKNIPVWLWVEGTALNFH